MTYLIVYFLGILTGTLIFSIIYLYTNTKSCTKEYKRIDKVKFKTYSDNSIKEIYGLSK